MIGADLYSLLVDGEVKKNDGSGLVAIRSKFGWLVGGSVPRVGSESGFIKSCLSATHVLYLQNFAEAEAQLNEGIKKFWHLDSVEIRDMRLGFMRSMRARLNLRTVGTRLVCR